MPLADANYCSRVTGVAALCLVALMLAREPAVGEEDYVEEEYVVLRGIMHVPSDFSTGKFTLAQIAYAAFEAQVDVVVASDAALVELSYGLPFLRNLVSIDRGERAILSGAGAANYLAEIGQVADAFPELVFLSGVESAPFHYWDLDLLARTLTVHRRAQHLLAVDLDSEQAINNLPILESPNARVWGWSSLLLMWPLLGFAIVVLVGNRQPLGLRVLVFAVSALCLINNLPFKIPLMDAYHGDIGPGPYQNYINYVNGQNGLVFWSHPEAMKSHEDSYVGGLYRIGADNRGHAGDLLATEGYAGLAVLTGNRLNVARPGGEWDRVLGQYVDGQRSHPPWGIGTAPIGGGHPIDQVLTVFHAISATPNGVRQAMANGRMYAVQGGIDKLELTEFSAEFDGAYAEMGETLVCEGDFAVNIGVARTDGAREEVEVVLIQSGKLIASDFISTPDVFAYDTALDREHEYVRLVIYGESGELVSNPVFIRLASP